MNGSLETTRLESRIINRMAAVKGRFLEIGKNSYLGGKSPDDG